MTVDIYQEVTDRIVAALEKGVTPWIKPWTGGDSEERNAFSGRPYSGVNAIVLALTSMERGYSDSRWATFNQIKGAGGMVRKGEKGTRVVFWKIGSREVQSVDGAAEERSFAWARFYTVFNVEQCDGLDMPAFEPLPDAERFETVDAFIANTGAKITHCGARACYSPSRDAIQMPAQASFESPSAYYSTALHELGHWTGHESRCARTFGARFGDQAYAVEELVAELSSAFACAALGIEGKLQHAEYLGNWARVLRTDKRAIFTAASAARKAHGFLADLQPGAKAAEVAEAA